MFASARLITLTAIVGVALLSVSIKQAEAGPFWDWLWGRNLGVLPSPAPAVVVPTTPVPQVTSYAPSYPSTTVVAPQALTVASPVVAGQPVTVASPVVAASPVVTAQPVITGYAGYTTYRTTWNRIPVTYYRPVTAYTAGYPTVAAQPCNTCMYQPQRVPRRWWQHHRPWLPFTSAAPVTYGYAAAPTVAAPAAGCSGCSTTSAAPAYYSQVEPGAVAPAVQQAPFGGVATPADQAPSLLQGNYPPAGNFPAQLDNVETQPAIRSIPGTNGQQPGPSVQPNSNVETQPAFQSPELNGPTPATVVPADPASTRRIPSSPYRVTPIPAPDVRTFETQPKEKQAPPLLNSRDRTVFTNALGQTGSVGHASWVTAKPTTNPPAPVTNGSPKQLWNDSGWHSAR